MYESYSAYSPNISNLKEKKTETRGGWDECMLIQVGMFNATVLTKHIKDTIDVTCF